MSISTCVWRIKITTFRRRKLRMTRWTFHGTHSTAEAVLENCESCSKWMGFCVMCLKQRLVWGIFMGICVMKDVDWSQYPQQNSWFPWAHSSPCSWPWPQTQFHLTTRISLSSSSLLHSSVAGMWIQFWDAPGSANERNILGLAEAQMKGT